MQYVPKNLKFKKTKKGSLKKIELKNNLLKFGAVGLKASESGIINLKQLELSRQIIAKKTKKKAKVWVKIFGFLSITSKPLGTRMGKGKGKISYWGSKIAKGCVLFEISGSNKKDIINGLIACKKKLPIKTKICYKFIFG
jgi:large subunit ribosomal protein L16